MGRVQEDEGELAPVEERMTTEQLEVLEQLARRAVACKRWRWMPGMLAVHHQDYGNNGLDGRVIEIDDKEGPMWIGWGDLYLPLFEGSWPDLSDPATLGCLLGLVREAWGPAASVSVNMSGFWAVGGATVQKGKSAGHTINLGIWKNSELDALVSALEVAP